MAEFLANGFPVATGNAFTPQTTLGPAAGIRQILFSVLGTNAVIVQCWKYTDENKTKWILEPFTRVFAGQSIGIILKNCAGIRIANATAGKSSLVVGEIDFETDIDISGGSITSAALDAAGNILPFGSGSLIGFDVRAGQVQTAGTTFATGADLLATPLSFTADGTSYYLIQVAAELWINGLAGATNRLHINLDGDDWGIFYFSTLDVANANYPCQAHGIIVPPAAGPHTVNARLVVTASTGTINGGGGGAGSSTPILVALSQL